MIDERLERLMDDVLDGSATAADEARLQSELARDAEARAHFEELQHVFRMLAAVPTAAPPETLRPRVMEHVRAAAPRGRRSIVMAARPAFVRLAFAFASGAVVSALVLVVALAGWPRVAGSPLPFEGTMLPPRAPSAVSPPVVLQTPDGRVTARTSWEDQAVRVDLDVDGVARDLRIDSRTTALRPTTVHWRDGRGGRIITNPSGVQFAPEGPAHYQVWFEAVGHGTVDLELLLQTDHGLRMAPLLMPTTSETTHR